MGFAEIFGLKLKVLWKKTKVPSKFFIASVFISDRQCSKIPYIGLFTNKLTVKIIVLYNALY